MSNPDRLDNELMELRQRNHELENELKQVKTALQQERDFVATVLDTTDDLVRNFVTAVLDIANACVVVFDTEGRILNFNAACSHTTNYSLAEVSGKHVWDVLTVPEEASKIKAIFQKLAAGESVKPYESTWITKEGMCREISWSHSTMTKVDGSSDYILGTGIDISQQKSTEAAMLNALEKEKALNELKSNFITMASHEIRTPLATILSSVELLEHYGNKLCEDEKREMFEQIKTAIQRLVQLLNDVLAINKRGKMDSF